MILKGEFAQLLLQARIQNILH